MIYPNEPPDYIYLQYYAEDLPPDLEIAVSAEVTWCVDQINDNDPEYRKVTPELDRAVNSHDALVEACEMAMAFIINGAFFGYITMPDDDVPDSAKDTPRVLAAALALARGDK